MWDLSSPTRDQTHAPALEGKVLIIRLPGKPPTLIFFFFLKNLPLDLVAFIKVCFFFFLIKSRDPFICSNRTSPASHFLVFCSPFLSLRARQSWHFPVIEPVLNSWEKIDLELIWNHCWVFSVQECEHQDQFLRISSKMIFVLDSGISGPWRGPLHMRSIEASVSRFVLVCADCGRRGEARWPWEGRCPLSGSLPHHSTFFHRLIYGDKGPSFFWPSKHSFLSKWLLHFLSLIKIYIYIYIFLQIWS